MRPAAARIKSQQIPASFGVHGPGESTIASGASASAYTTLSVSFLCTSQSAPSSPR